MKNKMTIPALVQEAAIFSQLIYQIKQAKKPLRCDLNFDILFEICEGSINSEEWKSRLNNTWFIIYNKEIIEVVENNNSKKKSIDIIILPAWKLITDLRKGRREFPII